MANFHLMRMANGRLKKGAAGHLTNSTKLLVTTTALPNVVYGQVYTVQMAASGGATPYTWSVASGAFPSGISLSSSGLISGSSTAAAGSYTVTISCSDNSSQSDTKQFIFSLLSAYTGNISVRLSWYIPSNYIANALEGVYDLGLYVMQPDGWWLGRWTGGWVATTYTSVQFIWPYTGDARTGGSGAVWWNAYPRYYTYPGVANGHACPEKVHFPTKPAPEGNYKFFVREWDSGQALTSYFIGIYRNETLVWGQNRALNGYPHYSPLFGFNSNTNTVYVIEAP
jgi:hypothetical protein